VLDRLVELESPQRENGLTKKLELEKLMILQQRAMSKYTQLFQNCICDPSHGRVTVKDVRYVFFKASSISVNFFNVITELFPVEESEFAINFATNLLYDFARSIGTI
jgi:hypothetical protein